MSEAKHTPGPWEWCETESGIYGNVRRSVHKGVEHVNREQVFPFFDSDRTRGLHGQRHEADKRLIAAAPQLLEALQECITDDGAQCIVTDDVASMIRRFRAINALARDAIRAATGE